MLCGALFETYFETCVERNFSSRISGSDWLEILRLEADGLQQRQHKLKIKERLLLSELLHKISNAISSTAILFLHGIYLIIFLIRACAVYIINPYITLPLWVLGFTSYIEWSRPWVMDIVVAGRQAAGRSKCRSRQLPAMKVFKFRSQCNCWRFRGKNNHILFS